jgi:hypothetical protein
MLLIPSTGINISVIIDAPYLHPLAQKDGGARKRDRVIAASLASEKAPRASAERRPDGRKHDPAGPVDPPSIKEGIIEIVLTLKPRAA